MITGSNVDALRVWKERVFAWGAPGEIAAYKRGIADACDVISQVMGLRHDLNLNEALRIVSKVKEIAQEEPLRPNTGV
jgi:hypothetical protein